MKVVQMTRIGLGLLLMTVLSFGGELKVGDEAPDFELKGSDGSTYKLSDLTEESVVVLAWFPKAFTGG